MADKEQNKTVTFTWQVADVKAIKPNFTNRQCIDTLEAFENYHDGSMSAMWEDLTLWANEIEKDSLCDICGEQPQMDSETICSKCFLNEEEI